MRGRGSNFKLLADRTDSILYSVVTFAITRCRFRVTLHFPRFIPKTAMARFQSLARNSMPAGIGETSVFGTLGGSLFQPHFWLCPKAMTNRPVFGKILGF